MRSTTRLILPMRCCCVRLRGSGANGDAPISAAAYAAAMSGLQIEARKSVVATVPYDIVLTPTLANPPQPTRHLSEDDPSENLRRRDAIIPFCGIYNRSKASKFRNRSLTASRLTRTAARM